MKIAKSNILSMCLNLIYSCYYFQQDEKWVALNLYILEVKFNTKFPKTVILHVTVKWHQLLRPNQHWNQLWLQLPRWFHHHLQRWNQLQNQNQFLYHLQSKSLYKKYHWSPSHWKGMLKLVYAYKLFILHGSCFH